MARTEPVIMVTVIPEGSPAARVNLSNKILEFEYEDDEAKSDRLRLTIDNNDLSNFDDPIWRKGNYIDVTWGYPEALAPTRRCRIQSVKGFQKLKVEAVGREVVLNAVVKSRVFRNMTRGQVVQQIAVEQGYRSTDLLHIEDTEVEYPTIVQARLTDAQFIRRLAHKEGCQWYIDFDGFHFHRRDVTQKPRRVLEWRGAALGNDALEIIKIEVENDITARPGRVLVVGHDPGAREGIAHPVSHDADPHQETLGHVVEAPGSDTPKVPGFKGVAQDATHLTTETNPKAVERHAAALFKRGSQVAVQISLEMLGDPNMLAKSVVELRGVGKRLSQPYYVKTVTHKIRNGYQCVLKMVSDGSGGHSTKSTLATEASAVQVGPPLKGKKPPAADHPRPGIAKPLHPTKAHDAEGHEVTTFRDQRHRTATQPPTKKELAEFRAAQERENEFQRTGIRPLPPPTE